ncbi:hypothetical protein ACFLTI_02275 [Bacteroidota bacterium]
MKKLITSVILTCLLLIASLHLNAQDNAANHSLTLGLPEVALLSTQSSSVNLTLSANTTAGEPIVATISDSSAYIQFSSVISTGSTRTLSAKYTGTMPGGTYLAARVQAPNANTAGDYGTLVASDVTLGLTDNTLVSDIGSCYSGTSADDGYRLKYTWGLNDPESNYADIRASAAAALTVVLTITAAN